ncbi:MAG: N-acetyltransferase [Deltaproteobacteria bacterium]|nr:N-acetyltransferase [Deltaproteobacteria bacterium]
MGAAADPPSPLGPSCGVRRPTSETGKGGCSIHPPNVTGDDPPRAPSAEVAVRAERVGDNDAIRRVNEAAFGRIDEAGIVDALRAAGALPISLVAELDGAIVGHLAMSPITIDGIDDGSLGLAPMAVLPSRQRRGVGGALVRAGLAICRARRIPLVVVLGHAAYYPRFGFVPAAPAGLRWIGGHDASFFATGALRRGVVRYRPEIGDG